ncbi:hypothetical protein NZA78_004945 [Escherichia coli]|nr:hypothetical protein [Escherichia coli]
MNKNSNNLELLQTLVYKKPSSKEAFIGLITIAIYSREIFVKNEDAAEFVKNVFGLSFLDYVIKSRTLLCARLTRNLVNMSERDIKECIYKASEYFKTDKFIIGHNENSLTFKKSNVKRNANRDVGTWINALLKKDRK